MLAAARRLAGGAVLAVKGIGGYHLACDAANGVAVAELRARKRREDRPFALMVRDEAMAGELVELGDVERTLLVSVARPIVLAPRRPGAPSPTPSPRRVSELGVMLPYAPLHHLLLADLAELGVESLVLTSGNVSDEPIAFATATHCAGSTPSPTASSSTTARSRRARTTRWCAASVAEGRRPLRCGARAATCRRASSCRSLPRGRCSRAEASSRRRSASRAGAAHGSAITSAISSSYPALVAYRQGVDHFERLFALRPELVAHDLHPDYASTAFALELDDVELTGVQHHHAHLAACLAEHGLEGPAVGVRSTTARAMARTGRSGAARSSSATSWLRACGHPCARCACPAASEPCTSPGGWRAPGSRRPAAAAATADVLAGAVDVARWHAVASVAASASVSPATTSMGRLFDAVAALCGLRAHVSYEGQAADRA